MVHAFDPMSCPNLAVPTEVMQHVAQVESSANPFAIGVVGGRLERQPRNLDEAIATARMLEAQGYNYSLGIAQVNRSNLARYGLDTYEKAFDGCANLAAGARILAECHGRARGDWDKAFSCYYSGNFVTGYRDGYVQRIHDSIGARLAGAAKPITVFPETSEHPAGVTKNIRAPSPGSLTYRVAIRSVAADAKTPARAFAIGRYAEPSVDHAAVEEDDRQPPLQPTIGPEAQSAFRPRVSGPDDPPAHAGAQMPSASGAPSYPRTTGQATARRQESADAAFVF